MIPSEYIISKINQYTKRPIKIRHRNAYNFECPICNEGKSSGKKRRGYYDIDKGYVYCHNCNRGWDPIKWIQDVCQMSYKEVLAEAKDFGYTVNDYISARSTKAKKVDFGTLPDDSINLLERTQVNYYSNELVVQACLNAIQQRRLNKAVNRPKSFWVSLKDKVHKNRLVIPFYDDDNQIRFYQTRAIMPEDLKDDRPKYLSKLNADKRIYGMNNIDPDLEHIFIFEGPIDSMFTKNGIAICGTNLTEIQEQLLRKYSLYQHIWVLDNQFMDKAGREKTLDLIEQGARVFIWPKELMQFKDLNDVCIKYQLDQISNKFIVDNSFAGLEAKTKLLIN